MPKKEDNIKKNKAPNWNVVLVVLIIAVVFLIAVSNDFSSETGSAVRGSGSGSKKADLTPIKTDLQEVSFSLGNNSTLLTHIHIGSGVANIGGARAKESVLEVGMQSDYSLEGVSVYAYGIYSLSGVYESAVTIVNYIVSSGSATIGIKVNPLQAGTGETYHVNFVNIPLRLPPRDGTATETRFTFHSIADATSVIGEANENNNRLDKSYILHCAYNPPSSYNPFCCVKRVDPLSTRYEGVRYCEDYGIY